MAEETKGAIDQGMFDFQSVMDSFYKFNPKGDDSEASSIKRNFQANMIQSGFDSQLAKDMAQNQAGIAQSNMTHAADLEARNTSSNMEQEFNYGMQSMGAQFDYQDKFANNQYDRDLGTLAATGEQERAGVTNQAEQGRETMREDNRLQAKTRADQSSYANKGARSF
jgi:hypothetical protein